MTTEARMVSAAITQVLDALNVSGWRVESDHDCDGTEEVCAVRCPIAVQVQVSPSEVHAALTATLAPILDAARAEAWDWGYAAGTDHATGGARLVNAADGTNADQNPYRIDPERKAP